MVEESRAGNRLINTRFIKSLTKLTNRALLLYLQLIVWADSMGAVGETEIIITLLQAKADNEGDTGVGLVKTDYRSALDELVEKGLVYEKKLTSGNVVHLIKHWWKHNKWRKYLKSNYYKAISDFYIEDGEYRPKSERKKKKQEERSNTNTKTNTNTKVFYENKNEIIECVDTHEEPLCNEKEIDGTMLSFDLTLRFQDLDEEQHQALYDKLVELGADEDDYLDDRFVEIAKEEHKKLLDDEEEISDEELEKLMKNRRRV